LVMASLDPACHEVIAAGTNNMRDAALVVWLAHYRCKAAHAVAMDLLPNENTTHLTARWKVLHSDCYPKKIEVVVVVEVVVVEL